MTQTFDATTVELFEKSGVPINGNEWAAERVQSALIDNRAVASALGRGLTKSHLKETKQLEKQIVAALRNEVKAGTLKTA